jgi:two-component system NtrC family sensor kinase
MLNLATNALHAMKDGGKLTIRVTREGGEVKIAVADTGVGIAEEDRAKLFEPFFTTRPEGTGLGLSVSYGIVKAHGGRIDVDSAPGRGATFTVSLPVDPPEGVPA